MEQSPLWFTILAIVASVLSAGGIGSQIIAWRRQAAKDAAELEKTRQTGAADVEKVKVTAKVELKKVEVEAEKHEREDTARFQQRLIDRIESLEKRRDDNDRKLAEAERKIEQLEDANERCDQSNRRLSREHELLKEDHAVLRLHVAKIETTNKHLRAKLAQLAPDTFETEALAVDAGARAARSAAGKG